MQNLIESIYIQLEDLDDMDEQEGGLTPAQEERRRELHESLERIVEDEA